MAKLLPLIAVVLLAAGCATLPDVEVAYYAPKSRTAVAVTQSLDCNRAHTQIFIVNAVTVANTYVADRTRRYTIGYKDFDRWFADADMTIGLTDDGRLKTINANSTGQGEAILKSAISVASAMTALRSPFIAFDTARAAPLPRLRECDIIAAWGDNKGVTLVYGGALNNGTPANDGAVAVDPGSAGLFNLLAAQLPVFTIVATAQATQTPPTTTYGSRGSADAIWLHFPNAGRVPVEVRASGSGPLWAGTVPVTLPGDYKLPIPAPALFGKQTFSLGLTESGVINSVGFGKGVGSVGALNSAAALLGIPDTAAEKAAQLKAEADLIAQTQRLARCQAKPDTCT